MVDRVGIPLEIPQGTYRKFGGILQEKPEIPLEKFLKECHEKLLEKFMRNFGNNFEKKLLKQYVKAFERHCMKNSEGNPRKNSVVL